MNQRFINQSFINQSFINQSPENQPSYPTNDAPKNRNLQGVK